MNLVYHLGYPRTATTLFQKHIFLKNHPKINYLGTKHYDNIPVQITQSELDNYQNNAHDKFLKYFSKEKTNLISCENYLSYKKYNDLDAIIALKEFYKKNYTFKFKIIYTIRNQFELIKSLYYHSYPVLKEYLSCKSIEELICKISEGKIDNNENLYNYIKSFDFNYTYDQLKNKFNDAEMYILNYDDLLNNSDKFLNQWSEVLGISFDEIKKILPLNIKENPSKTQNQQMIIESSLQTNIRKTRGDDTQSACGQLAGEIIDLTYRTKEGKKRLQNKSLINSENI